MKIHNNHAEEAIQNVWVYKGSEELFHINIHSLAEKVLSYKGSSEWTALNYHKCSICPLNSSQHGHCPAAVVFHEALAGFKHLDSYDLLTIKIEDRLSRHTSMTLDAQQAAHIILRSTIFLSPCPILEKFNNTIFGLNPLATENEFFSHFIAKSLLMNSSNKESTLNYVQNAVEELNEVNFCLSKRLKNSAENGDALINAIVINDFLWKGIDIFFEEVYEQLSINNLVKKAL